MEIVSALLVRTYMQHSGAIVGRYSEILFSRPVDRIIQLRKPAQQLTVVNVKKHLITHG